MLMGVILNFKRRVEEKRMLGRVGKSCLVRKVGSCSDSIEGNLDSITALI